LTLCCNARATPSFAQVPPAFVQAYAGGAARPYGAGGMAAYHHHQQQQQQQNQQGGGVRLPPLPGAATPSSAAALPRRQWNYGVRGSVANAPHAAAAAYVQQVRQQMMAGAGAAPGWQRQQQPVGQHRRPF
jgi:hypothetical protein